MDRLISGLVTGLIVVMLVFIVIALSDALDPHALDWIKLAK